MDTLTPEQRSARMGLVKARNTVPELAVRRAIRALGFHFGAHVKSLPGRPDVVLRTLSTVIFVHGCFWHRHHGCARTRTPKTRREFWIRKFNENVARDRRTARLLRKEGWRVLVIWECQTEDPATLSRRLRTLVRQGDNAGKAPRRGPAGTKSSAVDRPSD